MFVLLSPVVLQLPSAVADSAVPAVGRLPSGRYLTSAATTGALVHVFGGWTASTTVRDIVRYDPVTDNATLLSAQLPTGLGESSAVFDPRDRSAAGCPGGCVYLFGGFESGVGYKDKIVRFNPATGSVQNLSVTLPGARTGTSAVWAGTVAYIFGGGGAVWYSQILRFDPVNNTVATVGSLPSPKGYTAAYWDGQHAFVFGGYNGTSSDEIVRFDPLTNQATVLAPKLPAARRSPSAVGSGDTAYVFGGQNANGTMSDEIVVFRTLTQTISTSTAKLPSGRAFTSAAWGGTAVYVFGGLTTVPTDQIVRYTPDGPPPPPPPPSQCSDGVDNDLDGRTDYPSDPDCTSAADNDESGGVPPPPPIGETGPVTTRTLHHVDNQTVLPATPLPPVGSPGVPTPAVGQTLVNITIENATVSGQPFLCVSVQVGGGSTIPLACANRVLLGPSDPLIPRGTISLLRIDPPDVPPTSPGALGTTPATTVTIDARYTYDAGKITTLLTVGGGAAAANSPFPPTDTGAGWFATHGADVPLAATVIVYQNGSLVGAAVAGVPWLGQLIATALADAGVPP
ncbi:MAG: Kelch repeat-containing protein [Methanobacteriota archaeon]